MKYASPWAISPNCISGGNCVSRARVERSDSLGLGGGIDDVRVMCGWKPGDCGKLGEEGNVVDVNRESAA